MIAERSPVLQLQRVSKTFRAGFRRRMIHALRDVTLEARPGEILAVLGPNGAGKTTLFKIALGLLRPTSGAGTLLGRSLGALDARREVGYQPEEPYFYPALTAHETLTFMAGLCRLRREDAPGLMERVIASCALGSVLDTQVRKLSRGWLQRLSLATALLPDPQVLFLDEPLSGLDPEARITTRNLIGGLRAEGKTVLVSSHVLPDIEMLADRVALLQRGRVVTCSEVGSPRAERDSGYDVEICGTPTHPWPATAVLRWERTDEERSLWWFPEMELEGLQCLLAQLIAQGTRVVSARPHRESLEDFFVRVLHGTTGSDASMDRWTIDHGESRTRGRMAG